MPAPAMFTEAHTMLQGITTKYYGPTNCRGSKVIATTASGMRHVWQWDHARNPQENHQAAARALVEKLGWEEHGVWQGGSTKDGYAFVCHYVRHT